MTIRPPLTPQQRGLLALLYRRARRRRAERQAMQDWFENLQEEAGSEATAAGAEPDDLDC
jgi:hypothetical protein